MKAFESHPHWPATAQVAGRLRQAGFTALLAGGCVRDALLGRTPKDFDLATDATPDDVEKIFPEAIGVGRQFGVMILPFPEFQIEVATFRKDLGYQDGRRPQGVEFAGAKEDALRRDFTVNALFYDFATDSVLDFVGGASDLKARVIRAVGRPAERFQEDKLRILRALRFQAQLGFQIEAETYKGLKQFVQDIHQVSVERIREELTKLLQASERVLGLRALKATGLLQEVLPEVEAPPLTLFKRITSPDLRVLWATLFLGASGAKPALLRLKFAKRDLDAILFALNEQERLNTQSEWRRPELMRFLAQPFAEVALDVHALKNPKSAEWYRKTARALLGRDRKLPGPFLSGRDLQAIGYQPGPRFGALLKEAYDLQLEGDLPSRDAALRWLKAR